MGADSPHVVVVGGGISGLTTAHLLARRGARVTVLEPGPPGGKIASAREQGYLCEWGPQGFLDNTPETLALCEELGLAPLRAQEAAKRRFLWFRGRLEPIPEGPGALLRSRLLSVRAKLRLLGEPWAKAPPPDRDESVLEFACRRLGREPAERLVAAMVAGIYAGDAARLSMASALPRLKRLEAEHGSLLRALRKLGGGPGPRGRLTSLPEGLGGLPRALADRLGAALVRAAARTIEQTHGRFRVRTDGPASVAPELADAVVLAVPADQAAALLQGLLVAPAERLAEIPYAAVDVVHLGYARDRVGHDLAGFGYLVAPGEDLGILGCLWESSIFPGRAPDGHVLFRIVVGGALHPEVADLPGDAVIRLGQKAALRSLAARGEPSFARLVRHPRGIPQYTIGHAERVAAADAAEVEWPGLFLTGNALRGVGMNDCVRAAHAVSERVLAHLGGARPAEEAPARFVNEPQP